ncbi:unnamed protein product [Mytilus edulis]|uniref:Fibronectin type-III domain-containing protein n=1 Tax=Mytilus edulis TaxID=6550 RepID=A0A8S3V9W3_MYTED|nr:unnamed protein product [Mytilus edulis]
MPQITSLERTPYAILVKWKPGFDGGLRATYQIEYRKVTEITWDMINTKENIRNTFFIADPNTDYLETPSQRREEVSVMPGHYDEIESKYYNPIKNTISSQNHRNIAELGLQQLSNMTGNIESDDTKSSSYQSIEPCTVRQVEYSQKNYSARSSLAESYLIPCRMSDMSDNSETNIKSVQRYETLNFSAKNENMYTTYNVTDT